MNGKSDQREFIQFLAFLLLLEDFISLFFDQLMIVEIRHCSLELLSYISV